MKPVCYIILLVSILATPTADAEAKQPDQLVSDATIKIIGLLRNNRELYANDHNELYAMVYEHIVPYFDFAMISKLILARYWRQASEQQRVEFSNKFRDKLVRTYATALLKYTDEQFVFLPFNAKPNDERVIVKTEFKRSDGGPNVPVNYRLYRSGSGWKVYDVMIEGVSLVTNYRTVYAEKINKEGIDAVISGLDKLDEKVQ